MPLDKSGFTLPQLPYGEEALSPVVSAKTISFHYGKHHKAYVDKLNELIPGTPYAELSLEDIVKKSAKDDKAKAIFNNAGQVWNHNFYWQSMTPHGGQPSGAIRTPSRPTTGSTITAPKRPAVSTASISASGAANGTRRTWRVRCCAKGVLNSGRDPAASAPRVSPW